MVLLILLNSDSSQVYFILHVTLLQSSPFLFFVKLPHLLNTKLHIYISTVNQVGYDQFNLLFFKDIKKKKLFGLISFYFVFINLSY